MHVASYVIYIYHISLKFKQDSKNIHIYTTTYKLN